MVAASDFLLSFGDDEIIIDIDDDIDDHVHGKRSHRSTKTTIDVDGVNGVVCVAVPAPLSTAKNRGVFVLLFMPTAAFPSYYPSSDIAVGMNGG